MSPVYPDRAGGGERPVAVGQTETPALPPPALKLGDRVWVHTASCESPDQHLRVVLGGTIIERYTDGATLAQMDDGSRFELCPWFTSDCPNAVAVAPEVAA